MPHVYVVFRSGPDVLADPYWNAVVRDRMPSMARQLAVHSGAVVLDTIESSGAPPSLYNATSLAGRRYLDTSVKACLADPNSKVYEGIQELLDENTEYR